MIFSIKDLANLIKSNLPSTSITLCAEVRQPKNSNGHIYLNLKDNSGIISSVIWKSSVTPEIKNLIEGDKITVSGKLSYYEARGNLNFVIYKLINVEGKGELMEKYEKIKNEFEEKGYFLQSNKLELPHKIENILILTSKTGAALQDFYYGLENGNCKVSHTLVDVIVQGNDCPSNIIKWLENNDTDDYDLIVITRGGGSFEDLFGFCQPELIECIYKLDTPVLSAIGHQVDTTLLDYVADYVAPTPSLAAQFIVDHNKKYKEELQFIVNDMKQKILLTLQNNLNDLNIVKSNFNENIKNNMKSCIIYKINNKIKQLTQMKITNDIKLSNTNNNITNITELINSLKNNELIIEINNQKVKLTKFTFSFE